MAKKKYSGINLDSFKNKYIGQKGTSERDQYEFELKMDILGEMIKRTRKEKNLTQEQLGELIGVKKSEISKLENNTRNMTIGTILKVFHAMKANVKLKIEFDNKEIMVT